MTSEYRFLISARFGIWLLGGLALFLSPPRAAAQPAVPSTFQDLYDSLDGYLNTFHTTLDGLWNGTKYPVLFSGELTSADANTGPQLASPGYFTFVQLQIQALKAMGTKAITVEVGFPMLYQPFFASNPDQYQELVSFYAQVAAAVRAAGLKLVVENNFLLNPAVGGPLSGGVEAGWDTTAFYASLNWDQYQQARAQTAVVVAQTMQPDYMVVVEEPDTEAAQSGQTNADTVSGSTSMLTQILTSLQQAGITGIKFGAGTGTWMYGFSDYIQSYVSLPVDFIDFHVYSINHNFLNNALTIASIAASAGKPVAMTESWLWKVRDSELNVLPGDDIMARNAYSFWAPEDTYFIQTMDDLANYTQMLFQTPFSTEYFWAYQDYNTIQNLSPAQIWSQEMQLMHQANQTATYASTGMNYYAYLVSPPDTIPPSTPTNLAGASPDPNTVSLSWTGSTDNVGVAGYYVLRNGVNVATTANTLYQDTSLTGSTTYSYVVEAFDLGGNVSPASLSASVTTKDVTPPSIPANVSATAASCKQIILSWSPSADDEGISSYRVFEGTSATNLSQVATTYPTATSFTAYPLNPGTTYYFGVEAVDTSGNVSPMSAIVPATTLALPSAPTNLTATATSSTQISLAWAAGPSGLPITYYLIFRGTSPSNLAKVATWTATSYTDSSLTPQTTYYYAVQEVDSSGNVSPDSKIAYATTQRPPQPPTNLAATTSTKQVSLSWTPGVSTLQIVSYKVFRGNTKAALSQVATVVNTLYVDSSVAPATTYYYAVEEVDSSGATSAMSPIVAATTLALPSAPVNLVATAASATHINLTWSPGPSGLPLVSYQVYRGTAPSRLSLLATTGSTAYADTSLSPATTYYYAVSETDSAGNVSPQSTAVTATTPVMPSPPTNLAATAVSKVQISLSWTAAQSGMPLASYRIYRGSSATNLTLLKTVSGTATSCSDYPVTASTTYYYAVQSVDAEGDLSALSSAVQVTTPN
jgi:fibronectin type 3 domain-containing protein